MAVISILLIIASRNNSKTIIVLNIIVNFIHFSSYLLTGFLDPGILTSKDGNVEEI